MRTLRLGCRKAAPSRSTRRRERFYPVTPVDAHKLAVFVKLDDDFIHDAAFDIEDYLTKRLARNFAKAEDASFLNGNGVDAPTGILKQRYRRDGRCFHGCAHV